MEDAPERLNGSSSSEKCESSVPLEDGDSMSSEEVEAERLLFDGILLVLSWGEGDALPNALRLDDFFVFLGIGQPNGLREDGLSLLSVWVERKIPQAELLLGGSSVFSGAGRLAILRGNGRPSVLGGGEPKPPVDGLSSVFDAGRSERPIKGPFLGLEAGELEALADALSLLLDTDELKRLLEEEAPKITLEEGAPEPNPGKEAPKPGLEEETPKRLPADNLSSLLKGIEPKPLLSYGLLLLLDADEPKPPVDGLSFILEDGLSLSLEACEPELPSVDGLSPNVEKFEQEGLKSDGLSMDLYLDVFPGLKSDRRPLLLGCLDLNIEESEISSALLDLE